MVELKTANAELQREVAEREREAILAMTAALRSAQSRADMPPVVLDQLLDLFQAAGAALGLRDPHSGETVIELGRGDWLDWSGERLAPGQGLGGRVIATGETYANNSMQVDPLFARPDPSALPLRLRSGQALPGGLRAVACVPLIAQGQTIGALWVGRKTDIPADEVRLLAAIGDIAASAIHRATLHEQTQAALAEIQALYNVARSLITAEELPNVLQAVVDSAAEALPADRVLLITVDLEEQTVTDCVTGGPGSDVIVAVAFDELQQGLSGWVLRELQPALSPRGRRDPRESAAVQRRRVETNAGAVVVVPLRYRNRTIGTLTAINRADQRDFTQRDVTLMEAIGIQAAAAIENARLFQAAERRAAELETLRTASLSLTSSLALPEVLGAILEGVFRLVSEVKDAHIFLYQAERLTFGAALWADGRKGGPIAEPRPQGLTYTVARQGEPVLVPDMRTHALYADAPPEWRDSIVGLPLKIGARVVGVMNVSFDGPRAFSEAELHVLQLLGDQAAIAIENARLFEAERAQLLLARTLQKVGALLTSQSGLDEVLENLLELLARVVAYDSVSVQLLDEDGSLSLVAGRGFPDIEQARQVAREVGAQTLEQRWSERKALVLPDTHADSRWVIAPGVEYIRSWVGAPLLVKGLLIGVLNVDSRTVNAYDATMGDTVMAFANQASVAIENARLFEAERVAREQAETLQEATAALTATLDLDQVLYNLFDHLEQVLPFDSGCMFLLQGDQLRAVAARGLPDPEQVVGRDFLVDAGLFGEIRRTGRPLIVPDAQTDPRFFGWGDTNYVRGWMGTPLVTRGEVVGYVTLDSRQVGAYGEAEAALAQALANQASVAIENARLFEAERRRAEELAGLHEIAQAFGALTDVRETYGALTERLARLIGARMCVVMLYDPQSGDMVAQAPGYGVNDEIVTVFRYAARVARDVWDLRERGAFLANSRVDIPAFFDDFVEAFGVESVLATPMLVEGRVMGLVYAANKPGGFSEDNARLLGVFAGQAGAVIENARLFDAERTAHQQAETLRQVAHTVGASLELNEILRLLLKHLKHVLVYDTASILILRQGNLPELVVGIGYEDEHLTIQEAERLLECSPILRRMARDLQPVISADVRQLEGWTWVPGAEHVRSWLGIPLVAHGEMIGALMIDSAQPGHFGEAEAQLAQALAQHTAQAIENARLFETTWEQSRRLDAIGQVVRQATASLDLDELLHRVVHLVRQSFDYSSVNILLPDGDSGDIVLHASAVPPGARLFEGYRLKIGQEGITGWVAAHGEPLLVNDVSRDPRYHIPEEDTSEVQSELAVPVLGPAGLVGVLDVQSAARAAFGEADLTTLQTLAGHLAVAIDNAQLYETERQQRRQAETLREVAGALNSSLERERVLRLILEQLARAVAYDSASVMLVSGDELQIVAHHGFRVQDQESIPLRREELRHIRAVIEQRRPVIIPDTHADARWQRLSGSEYIRCWLGVPLVAQERVIGLLNLDSTQPGFYSERDARLAVAFANHAAMAIENARLFGESQHQARELAAIYDAALATAGVLETEALLARLHDQLQQLIGPDSLGVFLYDADAEELEIVLAMEEGEMLPETAGRRMQLREAGLTGHVIYTRQPYLVNDMQTDALPVEPLHLTRPARAWLGVPLITRDRMIGAVSVQSFRPGAFEDSHRRLLESLASYIAIAVESARLFEAAEAANRAKSEFLANTSHELRTPLHAISGYLQLLHDGLFDSPEEERRFIQSALDSSNHLLRIINDVLDIAKIEAGKLEVHVEPALLAEVLHDVQRLTVVQAQDKGLHLHFESTPELCVWADPARLRQVLLNLVGNAIKFTKSGGVSVRAQPAPDPAYALVEVQDTGIGVAPEMLPRLFEKFVQGNGPVAPVHGGTGLGLPISRSLIEMMGGQLELESAGKGCGARVWLTLPIVEVA